MPAPIIPPNFFDWLQQYFQDKPVSLGDLAADPSGDPGREPFVPYEERPAPPTDTQVLEHLSDSDPAYLEMPPAQPGLAVSPMGQLDPAQVAQQPGFLGPGDTYAESLAAQEGPVWSADDERAAREKEYPTDQLMADVAQVLYAPQSPLELSPMSFREMPTPGGDAATPPSSAPTQYATDFSSPISAHSGELPAEPPKGEATASRRTPRPLPGGPEQPGARPQYGAPFGSLAEEETQYPEDTPRAPGALPPPGGPFDPTALTPQVDLTAAQQQEQATQQRLATDEGPDELERLLIEQARRQPPHWTKALGLIGLGLTNPQAALQILGNDEQARQTAMQMLVRLGMDKKEAARFEKRLMQQEELQDKRMKAAEERQATRLEQQQFRDALDQVTRYATSVGAGHLLTPDRLKDRGTMAELYGDLDKLRAEADERKQRIGEIRSLLSSGAPLGAVLAVAGVNSIEDLQNHPDEELRRLYPLAVSALEREQLQKRELARKERYADAQIEVMQERAAVARDRTKLSKDIEGLPLSVVQRSISSAQSSITSLTSRIAELERQRGNVPLGMPPEEAALRDTKIAGEIDDLSARRFQEEYRRGLLQQKMDKATGIADTDPTSPLSSQARIYTDPQKAFEAALNDVTDELAKAKDGGRLLGTGDYAVPTDTGPGDPIERQWLFGSPADTEITDWDDIASAIAERFRRYYPQAMRMAPGELQGLLANAFAMRARQQATAFAATGVGKSFGGLGPDTAARNQAQEVASSGPRAPFPQQQSPPQPETK